MPTPRTRPFLAAFLILAASAAISGQKRPDFSGAWALAADRSSVTGAGAGRGRGAGAGDGGGLGLGVIPDRLVIFQDTDALVIQERRGSATSTLRYLLDGSPSRNMITAGRNVGSFAESTSVWRDNRLITKVRMRNEAAGGDEAAFEETRFLDPDGALVIETTIPGRTTSRKGVYLRVP